MNPISKATALYLEREAAANRMVQGADHAAILAAVADECGVDLDLLTREVLSRTLTKPN